MVIFPGRVPFQKGDLPTWDDIFPSICDSSQLLQALLASVANSEFYYRSILNEALKAGFRDPRMLQGLLWHAPHGEMRQDPEGLHKLAHWAAEIQKLLSAGALHAESFSPGPPYAAATPGAETRQRGLRGRPASPSSPEHLRNELDFLATLASRLEQQVDEQERQQRFSMAELVDCGAPSLTPQQNGEDLEELRRALEKFLSKNPDLLD